MPLQIEKIRIGHDGKGAGSGWFLDEVRIDVPSLGDSYVFACHRWLDEKEGDGLIEIELEPTEHQKSNPSEYNFVNFYTLSLQNGLRLKLIKRTD